MGTRGVFGRVVSILAVCSAVLFAPGVARSASRINATTVGGFHAVGCTTKPSARANKLMAVCKNGYLPNNVITLAPNSTKLSGKTLSQVVALSQQGLQARVTGSCGDARAMTSVGADGSVTCRSVQDGVAPAGYCATLAVPDAYAPCRSHFVTVESPTADVGKYTSIAIGADGDPVVSYYDVSHGYLKVAHCTDASCSTFDTPTTVDNAADTGKYTSIAIGTDGDPVVSYSGSVLTVAHCGDPSCSSGNTLTPVDIGVSTLFTSIAIGADGFPVIAYRDNTNFALKFAHCTNTSCSTFDTPTTVDSNGNVGQYTSIAIGADGDPVVSYYDVTNLDLKVAHCGNASCSTGNTLTTVDSTGDVGAVNSIAIGTDGDPAVSYWDGTSGVLKVAHCGNASCSSGNTFTTVDNTAANVGQFTSIAIANDGDPVVSYYDPTNGNLKVAHCGNASCSSGNSLTTVDSAGNVGEYTSTAIGADGRPMVSYYDVIAGDLKVARPVAG